MMKTFKLRESLRPQSGLKVRQKHKRNLGILCAILCDLSGYAFLRTVSKSLGALCGKVLDPDLAMCKPCGLIRRRQHRSIHIPNDVIPELTGLDLRRAFH